MNNLKVYICFKISSFLTCLGHLVLVVSLVSRKTYYELVTSFGAVSVVLAPFPVAVTVLKICQPPMFVLNLDGKAECNPQFFICFA